MTEDLKAYAGEDEVVNSHDFYEEVKKLPPEEKINFGIKGIDFITGGFALSNLVTVSGYTGFGKTSFCQTVSFNIAKQNIKSIWFSYELTARQFFNKYKDRVVPLFYLPKKNKPYDLHWIDARIKECKQKFGLQVVFIDHLHYVVPMMSALDKKTDLIGDAMRQLKIMAVKHNVTIFLMAHTKQPKGSKTPTIADLRDSSFVGQESDIVLLMHRPTKRGSDDYEDYGTCTVAKLRDGGKTGRVKLVINNSMFCDLSIDDERAL